MKFKFKNWPFPEGVSAYLYWVKSPRQFGESKQWVVEGLFISKNEDVFQFRESWGALPLLKLGSVFVDGSISDLPAFGEETEIKLSKHAECNVSSSFEKINNKWLDDVRKYNEKYMWERCVYIKDRGKCLLVVPCLEVVRTFFGINRMMSHLLLEPNGLASICSSEIEGEQVKIDFKEEIAFNTINDTLVSRIAAVLYQSDWGRCWHQVWNKSISIEDKSKIFSKIYCLPPVVRNCNWRVRGIPTKVGFFVLEILQVRSNAELPFSGVEWSHPNLTTTEGDSSPKPGGSAGGDDSNEPGRGDGEIDSEPLDPKGLTKPNIMPIEVAKIEFANCIKITKKTVAKEPNQGRQKRDPSQPAGRPSKSDTVESVKVTLADEGSTGTTESADFLPLEKLVNIPPGLVKFIEAVRKISNVRVGCKINIIPAKSNLRKVYGKIRHYALVHIVIHAKSRFILEIDLQNSIGISTLVFTRPTDVNGLEMAETLLTTCVDASGHWDLNAITKEIGNKYDLVKHVKSNSKASHWGSKLLDAVKSV